MKFNKLKSIFLSSALAISIFFTGCSNGDQNTITNQTQIKDSTSSNSQVSVESNSSYQDSSSSKEVPKGSVKATVERVVDGDTMKLKLDKTKEVVTLRLLLVDTPESVKKGVDPQPYSIEASNFAKNTLKAGDTVYIEYDEGDKTDKYDRHLGYLWYYSNDNSNWQMFNETLISQGYARVGYIYSQKRHLDEFYKAQDYAKSNKLNIWSVDGYVTDRGYDVDAYNSNKNTSSNSSSSSSNIVYANGGSSSSNKYHSTKDAHNMKGAIKMTEKEAKSKGYVPCGLCY
ncbi:thermonuclease family protein [Romboutsia timonensis]|uniref:thermonuclease family protein n=1 Tax=Romboutsia timonensis TaxID=1776391 RepID=UPI002E77510A|nr:thermonuclease family protein [Romboutsia timonensis]MEE0711959.1 thermonuclease family protein [Romboutsia timonensis]